MTASVTRLGDLLHFGKLFKACGNNYFVHIAHILRSFCKGVKMFHFSNDIIFGQLLKTFGNFLLVTLMTALADIRSIQINYFSRQTHQLFDWIGLDQTIQFVANSP